MSIASKITELTTARDGIRSALTEKGVSAESHGFLDFATDILSIPSGGGEVLHGEISVIYSSNSIRVPASDGKDNVILVAVPWHDNREKSVYFIYWTPDLKIKIVTEPDGNISASSIDPTQPRWSIARNGTTFSSYDYEFSCAFYYYLTW